VGAENFFLFGKTVDEVEALWAGGYRPLDLVKADPRLRATLELIGSGHFADGDASLFQPLLDNLLHHDPYLLLADFDAYVACQQDVDAAYRQPESWTRMSILNSARSGEFSSDRTIREYATGIWKVDPVPVRLLTRADVRAGQLQ
jgi:starch phosphorylase